MKKYFYVLYFLFVLQFPLTVYCQESIEDIISEDIEMSVYDANISNDWNMYFNNELLQNDNVLFNADQGDNMVCSPYFSLRGVLGQLGENISWDKKTNNISFEYNGDKFLITGTDEKNSVRSLPSFFESRYVHIKNISTNEYVVCNNSDVINLYTMNNTSYFDIAVLSKISKMTNADYNMDLMNKNVSIKKYKYNADFIIENIHKGMTYSEILGYLGSTDYFETNQKGGCSIKYNIDKGCVEMEFSPYTDDSDMKLVSARVLDKNNNVIEEAIK